MQTARNMSAATSLRQGHVDFCLPLEDENWADRETAGYVFKDARLDRKFGTLLNRIGSAMGESIPLACQDWANTKAAYRLFSNERVSEEDIVGLISLEPRRRFIDGHLELRLPNTDKLNSNMASCMAAS
jgi:Transposase DNA-binding